MMIDASKDIEFLIDSVGTDVKVNNENRKVIITNAAIDENEQRYIQSLSSISRGDVVEHDSDFYIVVSETINRRYGKYKAIMRHCNANISVSVPGEEVCVVIGQDPYGFPVEECTTTEGYEIDIPVIVDSKRFSLKSDSAVNLPVNQITVIVQENTENREMFQVNEVFQILERDWKVLNADLTKVGMIVVTAEINV